MISFLLSLAVISLSGVMMPGPMFAVTVAKSYRSPFAGMQIALGHAVIEVPLILLIYFGFARFFQHQAVQFGLSVLGGGIIVWLGVSMFLARKKVVDVGKDLSYSPVVAGILTSALNPFFILWWATIGSMLIMKSLTFGLLAFALLIPIHWLCDLGWLALISTLIYKTKSLWGVKLQQGLFIVCSLLLVGFGTWFVVSGVKLVV